MDKFYRIAFMTTGVGLFVLSSMTSAATLAKQVPVTSKKPDKVEKKGSYIYEWYNGPSPSQLPSEKEMAKNRAKKSINKTTGSKYDNTDPVATGCANDVITAKSVRVVRASDKAVLGTVELRYSRTCKTAWARMNVKNISTLQYGDAKLYRKEAGQFTGKGAAYVTPGDSNYTNQFDDDGTVSYAEGDIVERSGKIHRAKTDSY
ncbi:DUF2690 domain-containing protein [Thermoflavimicrobium daqui]|uniref:DUF2690 domain-containing protein n=1 Tax=Thermoflavimicrobium daqui TaxID=2137476 RepID=A0A364K1D6_9BACL|nr:DUF2690 domain-containing protein [Thermoflavimicrobium daqui]RAL21850.1 hypothetical protein DL897_15650 [Thermoflavimicrobium daqui]